MSKNILNKKQKRILYKNIGILFALTVLCGVFVRRISSINGETLQDLADRQEQETDAYVKTASPEDILPAEDHTSSTAENAPSSDGLTGREDASGASSDLASGPETEADLPGCEAARAEDELTHPEGEPPMPDRVTYQDGFYYESLNDTIKERITGISYPADDKNAAISYDTLRYVNVIYYNFQGEPQTGELICHKAIAQDLVEIFYELYEARYPIEKIALIDDYQGDDELSMQDNNTSCFNYRTRPSGSLSNHAYGLAVDLNPFYNPYVASRNDGSVHVAPAGSENYADRDQVFDYKIDRDDLACRLFTAHGFTWGGSWRSVKDYQHFEKEI